MGFGVTASVSVLVSYLYHHNTAAGRKRNDDLRLLGWNGTRTTHDAKGSEKDNESHAHFYRHRRRRTMTATTMMWIPTKWNWGPNTENIAKNGKTNRPGPSMAYRLIAIPISFIISFPPTTMHEMERVCGAVHHFRFHISHDYDATKYRNTYFCLSPKT